MKSHMQQLLILSLLLVVATTASAQTANPLKEPTCYSQRIRRHQWGAGLDLDVGWRHQLSTLYDTQEIASILSHGPVGVPLKPKGIVVHCTGEKTEVEVDEDCLENSQRCLRNKVWAQHVYQLGYDDIAYNYLIDPEGRVYEGRRNDFLKKGFEVQGAHTRNNNQQALGIALIGDFEYKSPSPAQQKTLIELLLFFTAKYQLHPETSVDWVDGMNPELHYWGPYIIGHGNLTAKTCPGTLCDLPDLITTAMLQLGYPSVDPSFFNLTPYFKPLPHLAQNQTAE